jgi:hypothetical protein
MLARGLVVYLFCLLSELLISTIFAAGDEGVDTSRGWEATLIDLTEPSIEEDKEFMNCLQHVSL